MKKKILIIVSVVLLICIFGALYGGKYMGYLNAGNSSKYKPEKIEALADSAIKGKTVIFLGSSVTYGMQAKGVSFVDYLEKRDGIIPVKEAVSGTTLVDSNEKSYISRMHKLDKTIKADGFICQLSTNDAQKNLPLGEVSDSFEISQFDTQTVCGAMEYIICYAKTTWNCPVAFYTGTYFENENYKKMIDILSELQKKWGIEIIDLYNELDINEISNETYKTYMNDPIHPTMKGYLEWWLPEFEEKLPGFLGSK